MNTTDWSCNVKKICYEFCIEKLRHKQYYHSGSPQSLCIHQFPAECREQCGSWADLVGAQSKLKQNHKNKSIPESSPVPISQTSLWLYDLDPVLDCVNCDKKTIHDKLVCQLCVDEGNGTLWKRQQLTFWAFALRQSADELWWRASASWHSITLINTVSSYTSLFPL